MKHLLLLATLTACGAPIDHVYVNDWDACQCYLDRTYYLVEMINGTCPRRNDAPECFAVEVSPNTKRLTFEQFWELRTFRQLSPGPFDSREEVNR